MKTRFPGIVAAFLLAACTPSAPAPWQLAEDLTHRYYGRPVNQFFFEHGLPAGEFRLADGRSVYRWASAQPRPHRLTHIPAWQPASCFYPCRGGTYEIADTYRGVPEAHFCELRIFADREGVVDRIIVAVDSMGKWSASRCAEIFR